MKCSKKSASISARKRVFKMKGQHRIVSEILIFAIGVAITSFVVISFQNVENSISKLAIEDQLTSVSNVIRSGIIKVADINSTIRLSIPDSISNMRYSISLSGNNIILSMAEKPISVTKQIFNIGRPYIIKGEVFSSAEYIDIISSGSNIMINRSGF